MPEANSLEILYFWPCERSTGGRQNTANTHLSAVAEVDILDQDRDEFHRQRAAVGRHWSQALDDQKGDQKAPGLFSGHSCRVNRAYGSQVTV
jgi:hypothetical protein